MATQNAPFMTRRDAVASVEKATTSTISTAASCLPANQLIGRRAAAATTARRVRIFLLGENSIGKTSLTPKNKASSGHQQQDHGGAPASFKIKVLSKHPDPMSRVIAEAMNIKNHTDKGLKNLNSKAEYHQAPIVRTSRQVTVGL